MTKRNPGHCIYCGTRDGKFNKEHVLFRSFSEGFANNQTLLDAVCASCNGFFCTHVDEPFALDTGEGAARFPLGLKAAEDHRTLGARQTVRMFHAAGDEFDGMPLRSEVIDGRVQHVPDDYAGFRRVGAEKYAWHKLGDLPKPAVIVKEFGLGPTDGLEFHLCNAHVNTERFAEEMRLKGWPEAAMSAASGPPAGRHRYETVAQMDAPKLRAIAKVAFNSLSHNAGRAECLSSVYDPVRRFIRLGEGVGRNIVLGAIDQQMRLDPTRHLVSVESGAAGVAVVVQFAGGAQYVVQLTSAPRDLAKIWAHEWNLRVRIVDVIDGSALWGQLEETLR